MPHKRATTAPAKRSRAAEREGGGDPAPSLAIDVLPLEVLGFVLEAAVPHCDPRVLRLVCRRWSDAVRSSRLLAASVSLCSAWTALGRPGLPPPRFFATAESAERAVAMATDALGAVAGLRSALRGVLREWVDEWIEGKCWLQGHKVFFAGPMEGCTMKQCAEAVTRLGAKVRGLEEQCTDELFDKLWGLIRRLLRPGVSLDPVKL
eukprot:m51a1_g5436 hypothetical protein (206) ;mRNA; r:167404-168375